MFETLVERLTKHNNDWEAARELGKLGDSRAIVPLIRTLRNATSDYRWYVEHALTKLEALSGATDSFLQALRNDDNYTRLYAAKKLATMGNTQVVESLVKVLKDNDAEIRLEAARTLNMCGWHPQTSIERIDYLIANQEWTSLANMGNVPNTDSGLIEEKLIQHLGDKNGPVRRGVGQALIEIGSWHALQKVSELLNDTDEDIAVKALAMLANRKDMRAVSPLLRLAAQGSIQALEALNHYDGCDEAIKGVAAIIDIRDIGFEVQAIRTLVLITEPDTFLQNLNLTLNNPDGRYRMSALGEMARAGRLPFKVLEEEFHRQITGRCVARPILRWLGDSHDPRSARYLIESFRAFCILNDLDVNYVAHNHHISADPMSVVEALKSSLLVSSPDEEARKVATDIVTLFSSVVESRWENTDAVHGPRLSDSAMQELVKALDDLSALRAKESAPAILQSLLSYVSRFWHSDWHEKDWLTKDSAIRRHTSTLSNVADEDECLAWVQAVGDDVSAFPILQVLGEIGTTLSLSYLVNVGDRVLEKRTWASTVDLEKLSTAASICGRIGRLSAGIDALKLNDTLTLLSHDDMHWLAAFAKQALNKMI